MKFNKIVQNILSESLDVSDANSTEYKAFGEFKIYQDFYHNKTSKKVLAQGKFEDAFGKTAADAIKELAIKNNFVITKDDFVFNDKGDDDYFLNRLRIYGEYYCSDNNNGISIDLVSNTELYEKWKSGEIPLKLFTYTIYLDKLISQPVTNTEEYNIVSAFK